MHDFLQAVVHAAALVGSLDPELLGIVGLSLRVSLSAGIIAMLIGAPLGGILANLQFPGRKAVIVIVNALLGLPPAVAGLAIYLLLSHSGPPSPPRSDGMPRCHPCHGQCAPGPPMVRQPRNRCTSRRSA